MNSFDKALSTLVDAALREDIGDGDHSTLSCIPEKQAGKAVLKIKEAGVLAGELKGKSFVPDHELAMSLVLHSDVPFLDLSKEEALRFLKKEALPNRFGSQGWHLMQYEGLSLGWGNVLPNRINNGLPKSWRILKEIGV